jgi:Family of unknown function (DUF5335)
MGVTKQIPRDEWKSYFDRFTRQFLQDDRPEAVSIELVSPAIGDQPEAGSVPLLGLVYDPKSQAFEVLLEGVDHLVFHPTEAWVIEEEGGFLSTIELTQADGTKELLYIHRSGPAARRQEQPSAPGT